MHAEGGGNRKDVVKANVALATLEARHVGPVHARQLGQLLLGKPARLPEIPDPLTETKVLSAYFVIVPLGHDDGNVRTNADYEATDYE